MGLLWPFFRRMAAERDHYVYRVRPSAATMSAECGQARPSAATMSAKCYRSLPSATDRYRCLPRSNTISAERDSYARRSVSSAAQEAERAALRTVPADAEQQSVKAWPPFFNLSPRAVSGCFVDGDDVLFPCGQQRRARRENRPLVPHPERTKGETSDVFSRQHHESLALEPRERLSSDQRGGSRASRGRLLVDGTNFRAVAIVTSGAAASPGRIRQP